MGGLEVDTAYADNPVEKYSNLGPNDAPGASFLPPFLVSYQTGLPQEVRWLPQPQPYFLSVS